MTSILASNCFIVVNILFFNTHDKICQDKKLLLNTHK